MQGLPIRDGTAEQDVEHNMVDRQLMRICGVLLHHSDELMRAEVKVEQQDVYSAQKVRQCGASDEDGHGEEDGGHSQRG